MKRRALAAGLILAQVALACPAALSAPAHAQIYTPSASASVDLSGYTPTSQLPAVIAANAPVQSVNGSTGAVSVPVPAAYTDAQAVAAAQAAGYATTAQLAAVQGAIPSIAGLLPATVAASTYVTPTQVPALSPVQSVNTLTGQVTVPGTMRASCLVSTFNASGVGTCTYAGFTGGTAFTAVPDCFAELTATNTSYVYAFPIVARTQTGVTVTMSAAAKLLNIALGATTIWTAPPTGTTLTVICRGQ